MFPFFNQTTTGGKDSTALFQIFMFPFFNQTTTGIGITV